MKRFVHQLRELWYEERGIVTVEYALLVALLAVGGIAAWTVLQGAIRNSFQSAVNALREPLQ